MRTLLRSVALLALLAQVSTVAAGQVTLPVVAITNVTILDVARGGRAPGQTVLIRDGRITQTGPAQRVTVPHNARLLEGRGKFLMPGLWDMHVHAMQSSNPAVQQRVFDLFVANGVTGIRDMGSDLDSLLAIRKQLAAGVYGAAPRVVAAGPLLDGPRFRWSQTIAWHITNADEAHRAVDSLTRVGVDFLKIYGSLPRAAFFAIADEARRVGLPIAGHIPLSVTSAEATAAGQISIEHNGMSVTDVCVDSAGPRMERALNRWTREGYAAWYAARRKYVRSRDTRRCAAHYATLRAQGTYVVPTIVLELRDRRAITSPAFRFLDAPGRAACESTVASIMGVPDSLRHGFVDDFLRDVREQQAAGVPMLAGTDLANACLVPGISLHDELAALVSAGLTPRDALVAATTAPAAFLERNDVQGRVATGQMADLVLLDADPLVDISNTRRIQAVIANGRAFDRVVLDSMLARATRP